MTSEKFNPQDVVNVLEMEGYEKVNRHLTLGWVLLGTYSIQYSEHGWFPKYSLGWLKQNGEIKFPEKTPEEKELEQYSNEAPF